MDAKVVDAKVVNAKVIPIAGVDYYKAAVAPNSLHMIIKLIPFEFVISEDKITRSIILDSIVVSILACHARDPGSIPGRGVFTMLVVFAYKSYVLDHQVYSITYRENVLS